MENTIKNIRQERKEMLRNLAEKIFAEMHERKLTIDEAIDLLERINFKIYAKREEMQAITLV